jgi:phosphoribosylamine--glycine ligase
MRRAGVPTARYETFTDATAAWEYARQQTFPIVLKADGLAAGKGVVVAQSPDEARDAIRNALESRAFGEAGATLLVEEFLTGEEISLLAVLDGRRVAPFVPARDHKRANDGDSGPNTGGMGAYAPTHLADGIGGIPALCGRTVQPIADALADAGFHYRGVLYAGLILTAAGPQVIEFNCRLGDPETQVVLPLLEGDFAEIAYQAAIGQLSAEPLRFSPDYCCGVVLAAAGYPGPYATGLPIAGLSDVDDEAIVFHSGTQFVDGEVVTAGGRVLTIVGRGPTLAAARDHAYANAGRIRFDGVQFRSDIGAREVQPTEP